MTIKESGLRILLVDDDADSRFCFSMLLESLGYQPSTVATGPEAIVRLKQDPSDVVLCDLSLTEEMSGLDLARFMRDDPSLRQIPIIALTGHGLERDRLATSEAGFMAHLLKPLELPELQQVLSEIGTTNGSTSRV